MPPPHTHTLSITHGSARFYWKRSAWWFIEQLLKLFYMRLYRRVTGKFKEGAGGLYQNQAKSPPTAAWPNPAPRLSPQVPVCADGGDRWPWNSAGTEGCDSGIWSLLPTPPSSTEPWQLMAQGCLVSSSQTRAQEQLSGGAEGGDGAPGTLLPWVQLPASLPATGRASISLRTSWCADTDHRGVLWVLIN